MSLMKKCVHLWSVLLFAAVPAFSVAAEDSNQNNEKVKDRDDRPPDYDPFGLKPIGSKAGTKSDADLTPDELLEKTRAKIAAQREKFNKEQEKLKKKNEKKKKSSDAEGDQPFTTVNKGNRTVELLGPDGNLNTTISKDDKLGDNPNGIVEMKGSRAQKSKSNVIQMGGGESDTDLSGGLQQGAGTHKIGNGNEEKPENNNEKRGFFVRLFGGKSKPNDTFKAANKGEEVKLAEQPNGGLRKAEDSDEPRKPGEIHNTLSKRVQDELARQRMEAESAERATDKEVAGMVVDVPPEPKRQPEGFGDKKDIDTKKSKPALAAIPGTPDENQKLDVATEADVKAHSEYQYKTGLSSRDIYAREASFQRAAVERREDAIPYMVDEIEQNKAMATQTPQYLAAIGKLNDEVETTLLHGLGSRDASLRQSCAEALGFLHSHKAVQPLLAAIKSDANYSCRSAYVSALGYIGDRTVVPQLKAVLNDKSEVEMVRSRTALALARMGDPSGRAHLANMLDSSLPAMQIMGLNGLAQLGDPEVLGYLNTALESSYEEVWVTAVYLFAGTGPAAALPVLRARLSSSNEALQRRAALAMGAVGSDDAVPYIDRALRVGSLQERILGCELMARLQRTDKAPLLIEKLQDSHTLVRQAAATALARLKAAEALPALIEAARGRREDLILPPGLRGAAPDVNERLTMMACVRQLRGETGDVYLSTLPDKYDQSWPELDRIVAGQQIELVKMYQLVDVVSDNRRPVGAVLKGPDGKELLVREGEQVAAGFKVRDIALAMTGKDKTTLPSYVTLMRGDEVVRLIEGRAPEVSKIEKK
jgi:HEAT repeat protein